MRHSESDLPSKFTTRHDDSDLTRTQRGEDIDFHMPFRAPRKINLARVKNPQPLFCRGLRSTALARKTRTHHHVPSQRSTTVSQNAIFDFVPAIPNLLPKAPLILTFACQRFSNVHKVPHQPRG